MGAHLPADSGAIRPFSTAYPGIRPLLLLERGISYLLVRLLNPEDPRWWVPIGGALGLGMETRYTIGFLALGIAGAVLLTPALRFLRSRWLWLGVAISILVFLPNLNWQMKHQIPLRSGA